MWHCYLLTTAINQANMLNIKGSERASIKSVVAVVPASTNRRIKRDRHHIPSTSHHRSHVCDTINSNSKRGISSTNVKQCLDVVAVDNTAPDLLGSCWPNEKMKKNNSDINLIDDHWAEVAQTDIKLTSVGEDFVKRCAVWFGEHRDQQDSAQFESYLCEIRADRKKLDEMVEKVDQRKSELLTLRLALLNDLLNQHTDGHVCKDMGKTREKLRKEILKTDTGLQYQLDRSAPGVAGKPTQENRLICGNDNANSTRLQEWLITAGENLQASNSSGGQQWSNKNEPRKEYIEPQSRHNRDELGISGRNKTEKSSTKLSNKLDRLWNRQKYSGITKSECHSRARHSIRSSCSRTRSDSRESSDSSNSNSRPRCHKSKSPSKQAYHRSRRLSGQRNTSTSASTSRSSRKHRSSRCRERSRDECDRSSSYSRYSSKRSESIQSDPRGRSLSIHSHNYKKVSNFDTVSEASENIFDTVSDTSNISDNEIIELHF